MRNICHRDIKPDNIILVSETTNVVKLIDFGVAHQFDPAIGMSGIVGTILFMAPEVIKKGSHHYFQKSDIYSIGVILYLLLTVKAPYKHKSKQHLMYLVATGQYNELAL